MCLICHPLSWGTKAQFHLYSHCPSLGLVLDPDTPRLPSEKELLSILNPAVNNPFGCCTSWEFLLLAHPAVPRAVPVLK